MLDRQPVISTVGIPNKLGAIYMRMEKNQFGACRVNQLIANDDNLWAVHVLKVSIFRVKVAFKIYGSDAIYIYCQVECSN